MKIAIVCEWLVTYAGAERVIEQILNIYPEADLFAVIDFLSDEDREKHFQGKHAKTTFIQKLPKAKTMYQKYLPLMPLAIEQLDVSGYDLVISISHAVAKGIVTGPDQIHISYINSPIRYAWDMQHQYLNEVGLDYGIKSWLARIILHYIRLWDARTANGVDYYIANSKFIAKRIKKVYGKESVVIYPPVDTDKFQLHNEKDDYYFTASRLVPYKKIKLIVEAFIDMPQKQLIVIGSGSEYETIKRIAPNNVIIMGYQSDDVLKEKLKKAKAFIFAAKEDFGIAPVEAQACGTPVIVYGKGGAIETTINNETGILFKEQTVESIKEAIFNFESCSINSLRCRQNAEKYSVNNFKNNFSNFINNIINGGK